MTKKNSKNKNLPKKPKGTTSETQVQRKVAELSVFRGPIPGPEILEYYSKIIPDAPERILRLAEKEADHRHTIETRKIELAAAQVRRGQWFGLIFGLTALVVVGVAVLFGAYWVAGILGSGTIAAVVIAFVVGRSARTGSEKAMETD